jgi:hypothetical protein
VHTPDLFDSALQPSIEDRALAETIHPLITASAPALAPKLH